MTRVLSRSKTEAARGRHSLSTAFEGWASAAVAPTECPRRCGCPRCDSARYSLAGLSPCPAGLDPRLAEAAEAAAAAAAAGEAAREGPAVCGPAFCRHESESTLARSLLALPDAALTAGAVGEGPTAAGLVARPTVVEYDDASANGRGARVEPPPLLLPGAALVGLVRPTDSDVLAAAGAGGGADMLWVDTAAIDFGARGRRTRVRESVSAGQSGAKEAPAETL